MARIWERRSQFKWAVSRANQPSQTVAQPEDWRPAAITTSSGEESERSCHSLARKYQLHWKKNHYECHGRKYTGLRIVQLKGGIRTTAAAKKIGAHAALKMLCHGKGEAVDTTSTLILSLLSTWSTTGNTALQQLRWNMFTFHMGEHKENNGGRRWTKPLNWGRNVSCRGGPSKHRTYCGLHNERSRCRPWLKQWCQLLWWPSFRILYAT